MRVRFIGQPFEGELQIGEILKEALRTEGFHSLWIATAWAKRSGVSRVRAAVADFAAAGGKSEVVIGIDEGGATREGLQISLEVFDDVYIYHDPGPRTFHPKIYAVESASAAVVVVGSGNMTKGGLFTNYEAAVVLEATPEDVDGWELRTHARAYFDRLVEAGDAVRRLDEELIAQLERDGWVTSEARQNARRSATSRDRREREPLFGTTVGGLLGAPQPDVSPLADDEQDEDSSLPPVEVEEATEVDPSEAGEEAPDDEEDESTPAGIIGFWKQLSNSDASTTSSPGQIIIPIGYVDFFPTLVDEAELTTGQGSGQSAAYFPVRFVDGSFTKDVPQARVVLYEPAPHHPRPNRELRFTFHDRDILLRLSPGDVLVFSRHDRNYTVERRPGGAMGEGRFGSLP